MRGRKVHGVDALERRARHMDGEVIHLRHSDRDRERRLMRVEQGKGKKDRYTLLSTRVINEFDSR